MSKQTQSPVLRARVTADLERRFRRAAKKKSLTASDALRMALVAFVEKEEAA